jgi:hypothetical protein
LRTPFDDNFVTSTVFDLTIALYRQRAAMPIRSFIQPGAFDPEAIAAMSEALNAALKELQDTGQSEAAEVIAIQIIAAAKLGERDPVRLLKAALRNLD